MIESANDDTWRYQNPYTPLWTTTIIKQDTINVTQTVQSLRTRYNRQAEFNKCELILCIVSVIQIN